MNNNLKKIRNSKGLTQQEIADYLNTSPQYIAQMENGVRKISKKFAQKLSNYFNVSIDYLLGSEAFKSAEHLNTTIFNLCDFFSNKGININNYQENDYDTLEYDFDKELLSLLKNLHNYHKITPEDISFLKLLSDMIIEKNTNPSLIFQGLYTEPLSEKDKIILNNREKYIIDTFNNKIDNLKEYLESYKIKIKDDIK